MNFYTMVFDEGYLRMLWDAAHVRSLVGEYNIDHRIDINSGPVAHKNVFKEPIRVSFDYSHPDYKGRIRGDLSVQEGRLYLNQKALNALKPLIDDDGDIIEVIDEKNEIGYVFTPLQVAEKVDAIDMKLTQINQWGDPEHLAFYEDRLERWNIFRCELNSYMSLQCSQAVKDLIEKFNLKGVFFTPSLGNRYPNQFDKNKIDSH
ncbi:hypothetical protein [Marinibactrum halimedae]|uniref:Uncharacterized protein n=1 Tax=Marinibactrum halimedae TaxID=1444977 RepID=A0AA37T415_9GAMM|nr:hypothetical protein [Marinibactrum halimedae]MCD9460189.1 hypothetical protein [Marinibactrum halimedae]GLS26340.1 hypothetical protein GCM10007877_20550 [Marinibactrum halimedae]